MTLIIIIRIRRFTMQSKVTIMGSWQKDLKERWKVLTEYRQSSITRCTFLTQSSQHRSLGLAEIRTWVVLELAIVQHLIMIQFVKQVLLTLFWKHSQYVLPAFNWFSWNRLFSLKITDGPDKMWGRRAQTFINFLYEKEFTHAL